MAPVCVKILTPIVSPHCRCKCQRGCEWRESRERQRGKTQRVGADQSRETERERCVSRLGSSLAPVCGSSELMCHPDPEGADSRAGEKRLLMLLGVCFFLFFFNDMGIVVFCPYKNR